MLRRSPWGTRSYWSLARRGPVTQGVENREQFAVAGFIEAVAQAASLKRTNGTSRFNVAPVEDRVAIEADRQVLASVLGNLLQNAFKFTRPHTIVTLRAGATADRVLIEIEDECGGLPADTANLFRPFEQRGANRSGLGLGLAYSRWAVEANRGRISARTVPARGACLRSTYRGPRGSAVALVYW